MADSGARSPGPSVPTPPGVVRCPQCGAGAAFDPAVGAVACAACGWREAERDGGEASAGGAPITREALEQGSRGTAGVDRELFCDGCGAVVQVSGDALATSCAFCGSHQVHLRDPLAVEAVPPSDVLPFALPRDQALAALRAWMGSSWMTPSDLATRSARHLTGIYLPFWALSAQVDARWTAQVGTPVRSGGGKTETRWTSASGETRLDVTDLPVPGSLRVGRDTLAALEPFDLSALEPFRPELLAGWQAVSYEQGLDQAWEHGRARFHQLARRACEAEASDHAVRNLQLDVTVEPAAWRLVLLPVFLVAFRYDGEAFVAAVNGQTGAVVGQRPVDWERVTRAMGACLLPAVLCAGLGWVAGSLGLSVPVNLYGLALLGLPAGGAVAAGIYRKAQAFEAG